MTRGTRTDDDSRRISEAPACCAAGSRIGYRLSVRVICVASRMILEKCVLSTVAFTSRCTCCARWAVDPAHPPRTQTCDATRVSRRGRKMMISWMIYVRLDRRSQTTLISILIQHRWPPRLRLIVRASARRWARPRRSSRSPHPPRTHRRAPGTDRPRRRASSRHLPPSSGWRCSRRRW